MKKSIFCAGKVALKLPVFSLFIKINKKLYIELYLFENIINHA